MAAQEKPKVIPVDNFVRDELYPGYMQAFGTQPFVAGPVRPFSKADNASYWLRAGELQSAYDFSPVYRNRRDCAEALVPAIRRDIQDLVAAGCDHIQVEKPLTSSHAAEGRTAENLVDLVNKVVDGVSGCTFVVHICFGSFRHLPYAKRTYRWLSPGTARRQRARVQPGIRRPRDSRDRPGRKMEPGEDSLRRADRHQNTLLRDTGGHYRARPHLPGIPRSRAAGDLHRLRPAPRPSLPGD